MIMYQKIKGSLGRDALETYNNILAFKEDIYLYIREVENKNKEQGKPLVRCRIDGNLPNTAAKAEAMDKLIKDTINCLDKDPDFDRTLFYKTLIAIKEIISLKTPEDPPGSSLFSDGQIITMLQEYMFKAMTFIKNPKDREALIQSFQKNPKWLSSVQNLVSRHSAFSSLPTPEEEQENLTDIFSTLSHYALCRKSQLVEDREFIGQINSLLITLNKKQEVPDNKMLMKQDVFDQIINNRESSIQAIQQITQKVTELFECINDDDSDLYLTHAMDKIREIAGLMTIKRMNIDSFLQKEKETLFKNIENTKSVKNLFKSVLSTAEKIIEKLGSQENKQLLKLINSTGISFNDISALITASLFPLFLDAVNILKKEKM